ncbi:hypothetical protein B0T14DRAFT_279792 [Immersiella caudata]|uniref:Secreted protein n=1 Tax=Immersiella caudata TaxID=314043 RepID=A0AA39WDM0_9PEZI|nr:hypothetical protein B0T14DRAFT_279792 [Immersiella caudata]
MRRARSLLWLGVRIWGLVSHKTMFGWFPACPSSQLLALAVRICKTGHGWPRAAKPRCCTAHFGCTPATSSPMSCRGPNKMRALWSTMAGMPSQPVLFRELLQMAETGSEERRPMGQPSPRCPSAPPNQAELAR